MGSVITKSRFSKEAKIKFAVFAVYFIGTLIFVYFGLQPATKPEEVYAAEAQEATASLILNTRGSNDLDTTDTSATIPVKPIQKIGKDLAVPEQIVGSYSVHQNKTLLVGHSSTAFKNLKDLQLNDKITYNGKEYTITAIEEKQKQDVDMKEILKSADTDTVVLMTCAGQKITGTTDYTHRLIITAA